MTADSFLHGIKVVTSHYYAGLIVSGIYLITPPKAFDIFHARQIAENYRPTMFWIFIICLVAGSHYFVVWVGGLLKAFRVKRNRKTQIKLCAETLSEDEKQILRFYILNKVLTSTLCPLDPTVKGLESKEMIWTADQPAPIHGLPKAPYHINTEVREHLNKNDGLLLGSTSFVREDTAWTLTEFSAGKKPAEVEAAKQVEKRINIAAKQVKDSLFKRAENQ